MYEYHQRRNGMASDDDVERQPVVLYKVGTVGVQGQSMPYSNNKSVLVSSSFTSAATSKKYTHCTRIQV